MRLRLALVFAALVIGAGQGWAAQKPAELLHEWDLANEACRDGSGEHATAAACELRDISDRKIKATGWCYGRPGEVQAQMNWHPCRR